MNMCMMCAWFVRKLSLLLYYNSIKLPTVINQVFILVFCPLHKLNQVQFKMEFIYMHMLHIVSMHVFRYLFYARFLSCSELKGQIYNLSNFVTD